MTKKELPLVFHQDSDRSSPNWLRVEYIEERDKWRITINRGIHNPEGIILTSNQAMQLALNILAKVG